MTIASYSDLKTAAADWLARNDIDPARASDFVSLYEARVNRLLHTMRMVKRIDLEAGQSVSTLPLPGDYLEGTALRHTDGALEQLTMETIAALGDIDPMRPAGRPARYAVVGTSLQLWPVPDQAYTLALTYYGGICPLSDAAGRTTNWLLQKHPDAYLNGTIAEVCDYIDDDRKAQRYRAKADSILGEIQAQALRQKLGAGPIVIRPA